MPRTRKKETSPTAPPFGQRLRSLRIAAGLSQHALAERSGLGMRTISGLETGRSRTTQAGTKAALTEALGLNARERRWLFEGEAGFPANNGEDAAPVQPLVGRESDMVRILEAVNDPAIRMLTLTGPGGVGKTRLAREIIRTGLGDASRARAFVALDELRDPADVLPAIAAALHLPARGSDSRTALMRALGSRPMLLVLDNLEHLLEAAPDLAWLLEAAPGLTILATSREAVRLDGERVLPISPLPADGDNAPAVRLFRQLAMKVNPEFEPGPNGLRPVSELCKRMGGLPLGIELAAAQMEVLSPADLLSLMEHAGLGAFDGGRRDGPERFSSMEAAIRWSWDRLPMGERRMLRTLSGFTGGFDVTAAAEVEAAFAEAETPSSRAGVAAAIMRLARRHMVTRQAEESIDPEPRFTLLEPIRLFALDRLRETGGEEKARRAHANWVLDWFNELDRAAITGPGPGQSIDRMERDYPNARAAFDWAMGMGEHLLASDLAVSMDLVWEYRDHNGEGRRRLEQMLALGDGLPDESRAHLNFMAAEIAYRDGDFARVRALATEQLEQCSRFGFDLGIAGALLHLSAAEPNNADRGEALARIEEARALLGDDLDWRRPFMQSWARARLGIELHRAGDLQGARAALEDAIARRRSEGNRNGVAIGLVSLAWVLEDMGAPQAAAAAVIEAYPLAAAFGDAWTTFHLSWYLLGLVIRHGAMERDLAAFASPLRAALDAERTRVGLVAAGAEEIEEATLPPFNGPAPSLAEAMADAWKIPASMPIVADVAAPPRPAMPPLE